MMSILEWTTGPASPLIGVEGDLWFFSEDDEKLNKSELDSSPSLTKSEVAQQLLQYIDKLKTDDGKAFPGWFEEKIDLAIFNEVHPTSCPEEQKFTDVQDELQTFDNELNISDVTPPNSPKNSEDALPLLMNFEDTGSESMNDAIPNFPEVFSGRSIYSDDLLISNGHNSQQSAPTLMFPQNYKLLTTCPKSVADASPLADPPQLPDLEKEMAIVDEVVRNTAQDLESHIDPWEADTSSSQFSSSCSVKSLGSTRSSTNEESDDPEWIPFPGKPPAAARKNGRRFKPYGSQEDRRLRKKEQNKNAATRYRQKKKAEVSEILEEEKALEYRKEKLKQQVSDIKMEINCLKRLMKDLFRAKGLLIN